MPYRVIGIQEATQDGNNRWMQSPAHNGTPSDAEKVAMALTAAEADGWTLVSATDHNLYLHRPADSEPGEFWGS